MAERLRGLHPGRRRPIPRSIELPDSSLPPEIWGVTPAAAHRALGAGRDRAADCVVAPLPNRRVRRYGVAAPAHPAPGTARAATAAWPEQPGPEGGGAVPAAPQAIAGAVGLCPCRWRG